MSDIKIGIKGEEFIQTDESVSASKVGSGLLNVFATPSMVALMEKTAHNSLSAFLEEGYTTVGTILEVKHKKPTSIGQKVTCKSELIKVDGNKLLFEITAWDEQGEIGYCKHGRAIVNVEKFLEML